jgi:superfamily II DNA or RNA helicase
MGLTGRLHLASDDGVAVVTWHDREDWRFLPTLVPSGGGYELSGSFRSSDGGVPLPEVRVLGDGFALAPEHGFAVEVSRATSRIRKLHEAGGSCHLSEAEARDWVIAACLVAGLPTDDVAPELVPTVEEGTPVPQVHVRTAKFRYRGREQLHLDLAFAYGREIVRETDAKEFLRSPAHGTILTRDRRAEEACTDVLLLLDCRLNRDAAKEELGWKLHPRELDRVVWELVERNWLVTAEGKTYRRPQEKSLCVSSGTDWLEIRGGVEFEGETVPLPKLLAAVKRGASAVRLDDGTYGLLPREWLEKFTVLTDLGEVVDDAVRFRLEQAMLLEALLRERGIEAEEALAQSREALASFAGAGPADAPESFVGTLRGYQRDGLGWLLALRDVGLGGCLADDMGLGKTVQVLSLLATEAERGRGPSLVVAPKSLVFNWEGEAARFTPRLRVRPHLGSGRAGTPADLRDVDLLLTTYGTLRQDVEMLATVPFHYVILDESQAIKNADTSTAKCARALRARHRLAMTGTPVENRLQDLFSQFQFLNPGLFGSDRFLKQIAGSDANSTKTAATVGKALRPLILRRTKAQVVKELPPKTEQTVFCELGPEQRREYDRLRDFYREELTKEGQAGQMDVLSALLRLRQVACHAGLVSGVGDEIPSAKLDVLFEELETLREEGRKALVFSQFTMLLQRVKSELQARGLAHCYLDGKTKDRGAEVERFQTDDGIGVFLISLKAGGVGLNLTAADTVFLLDPWWNPAAESQAIDRTYRIGQDRPVFAYRLIARDTVEEKVLALQAKKRQIANAAVGDEQGVVAALSFDDLCALLS